ncbi:MAG: chloride channel protein [Planctomycetes bacterium]|nr:chloride channel protein [Planctomycetota bacterium]
MSSDPPRFVLREAHRWALAHLRRGWLPTVPLTIILAGVIGVLAGYGAALFTYLIRSVSDWTVRPLVDASDQPGMLVLLCLTPAAGLLVVTWFTRSFAPEAEGHGVPEVITAVARHDGVIRPRVSIVKILASAMCIGTGGSIGREGPIVQIGSSLGSMAGQLFMLPSRNIKVLVAAGAAAGISATFNAPLAGVMFASEIILGSFAVESLTPIVIASVLADAVQQNVGEHRHEPAFQQLNYEVLGVWTELPAYVVLGLLCGLAAVGFTKLLYWIEDISKRWIPKWWLRAIVLGGIVGVVGVLYPSKPPVMSEATQHESNQRDRAMPPLFGVGYEVVDHALHLENAEVAETDDTQREAAVAGETSKAVRLDAEAMWAELWWLLPLVLLKPLLTSITLGGGGSGGIFAPSLFLGATLGAAFGLICNLLVPGLSANPGVYAIVGMGAVVAGTTHGVLSAILIVYEMTGDYRIILPIMACAGLSSVVAGLIDPESIYLKKLSRRGESIARGHDMHRLEHIMVRDVMVREFPTVRHTDNVTAIIRVARENTHIESLPVMDDAGNLVGIIRSEDLHRVLDSDISPSLLNADDIALMSPIAVSPDANLIEALRDFGTRDIDTLPVESRRGGQRQLVGLLLRSDVMRRYREEMLRVHRVTVPRK